MGGNIQDAEVANVYTAFTQVEDTLIQLIYSSKSEKVQALKCAQNIKVKVKSSLLNISTGYFCAKLN